MTLNSKSISTPSKLTKTAIKSGSTGNALSTISGPPCSISKLPYELRQLIYEDYFSSQPPISINKENASSPFHNLNSLQISSPFFNRDIPMPTIYQHSTFVFFSGEEMKTFSQYFNRATSVRRIRIMYGKDEPPTRDWVYLLNSCFENLEEITFSVDRGVCVLGFGHWWGCVMDACREGLEGKAHDVGFGGVKSGRSMALKLSVDGRELGAC